MPQGLLHGDRGAIFGRIWVLSAGQSRGTAASREECGEANSSKSSKALANRAQRKLASASNFLAVPDFVTGKGAREERPSTVRPARQARLLPPRHPPLEPGLFGSARPAWIKTSWRFYICGTGGLEAGNEAENSHIFIRMFQSYLFLASSTACLCYPPCFPSSRLFGITGSWREAQT